MKATASGSSWACGNSKDDMVKRNIFETGLDLSARKKNSDKHYDNYRKCVFAFNEEANS